MPGIDDIAFATRCIEERFKKLAASASGALAEAKQPDWSPEDGGAPPEMWVGDPSSDGYVRWKLVPSTLAKSDVCALQDEFGIEFPELFRAFLLGPHHLFDQVGAGDEAYLWPANPSDNPLGALRETLEAWRPVIGAGYVPFGQWGDGYGPVCFDAGVRLPGGDMPVVTFSHEDLPLPGPDGQVRREELAAIAQPAFASCREMMTQLFLG